MNAAVVFLVLIFSVQNLTFAATRDVFNLAQLDSSPDTTIVSVDDVNIPEDVGLVKDKFQGNGNKLIVHIQDAHCNYEAQTNIRKILELLMDQKDMVLVALEGSTGEIDTSLFTTFPDEEIREEVATYFMKKGKISGAEHLAINAKKPILLYGIENKEYYLENLEAFTNTLEKRPAAKETCREIRTYLNRLKQYIYSKELKELDRKVAEYDADKIKFVEFCAYLKTRAAKKRLNMALYENFSLLMKALDIEKGVDFKKVDSERSAIINELEKKLSQDQLSELFMKSLSYRTKKMKSGAYYTYLRGLAEKARVKLSKFKNFNLYVDYISTYSNIDNPSLFRELKALQEDIKEALYTNDDQRTLNRLSRHIRIVDDLVNISLSKEEAGYFLGNSSSFSSREFTDFIARQFSKYGLNYSAGPGTDVIDELLPSFVKFYEVAGKREEALLQNTLNKMEEKGYKVSALISGGYHTEGLTNRFKEEGISYIVVAPRITNLDAETPYLEILSGGKIRPAEEAVSEE